MEKIELSVSKRTVVGKQVNGLRRQGIVPAILYGRYMDKPMLLQAEERVLRRVLTKAGTSRLITLSIEEAAPQMALVREAQREPISGRFYHIDFLAVSMTEKIRLKVPIVLVGESPVVARNEGVLLQPMNEIEIECLPGDLIDAVRVDISKLDQVGAEVKVGDLASQLTVQILAEPDEAIVHIAHMREEKIEEAAPAEAPEVEVIAKGKVEEEIEEGAEEKK
jgi:large subunit ribosomal protein L25